MILGQSWSINDWTDTEDGIHTFSVPCPVIDRLSADNFHTETFPEK